MTFSAKTKLAVAVLAASVVSTAHSATVYEGNGLSYQIKGDWQVQLRQKAGDEQKLDVEFDDLELKNAVTYGLTDSLSAFGQLDVSFDGEGNDQSKDSAKLEEAYVGLNFNGTKVSIGRQNLAGDEFGVEAAYETHTAEDRFEQVADKGDDVVRVATRFGAVEVVASALLAAESSKNAAGEAMDLFVSTEVAGVKLAAAYQTFNDNKPGSEDQNTWGISASYNAGIATVAADYSTTDTGSHDEDVTNLVVRFNPAATVKAAIGAVRVDDGSSDSTEWYANASYQFPERKHVSLFVEVADTDEDNVSLGYLAGMQIKF